MLLRLAPRTCVWAEARQLSTRPSLRKDKAVVFESTSRDPYFNLALEDWLFRSADTDQAVLLFYRNSPSVIVGRNQNPWKEINFPALRKAGVPFVRRRSGGGTVYHDEGNTNYSISIPRTTFDRRTNAELVARGLVTLGVPAYVNERNDVTVEKFKVSGSAYKIANKRAYHHGTMLISAQLNNLGDLLRNKKDTLVTKGVDSVRSPVRNLRDFVPNLSHDDFVLAVSQEFMRAYAGHESLPINRLDEATEATNEVVRKGRQELQGWEWSHGQTPEFTHDLSKAFEWGRANVHIHSKKGIILDCSITFSPSSSSSLVSAPERVREAEELAKRLVGLKYGFPDSSEVEQFHQNGSLSKDFIQWLREDM